MRRWLIALTLGLAASVSADPPPLESFDSPRFSAELLLFHDEGRRDALLWIAVRVPLRSLYFEPSEVRARVRVAWKISQGGHQLLGDVIEREVTVEPEVRDDHAFLQVIPVELEPGKYRCEVAVDQALTDQRASVERSVRVREIDDEPMVVSSLYLTGESSSPQEEGRGRPAGLPLVKRVIGMDVSRLLLAGELYAPRGCPELFDVRLRVVDEDERPIQDYSKSLVCNGFRTSFRIPVELEGLVFGDYRLEFTASAPSLRGTIDREIWFAVDETRLPMREHFHRTVDLVRPIATREEISALESALPGEREAAWDVFWKSRDPDPSTPRNEYREEYFRRFRFANQHFGTPLSPGWKSDRGRIYLRHGEPDRVDRFEMSAEQPAREIWHYYTPSRRFVFVDRDGLGDYRLTVGVG